LVFDPAGTRRRPPAHLIDAPKSPATPDAMVAMGLLGHIGGVNALLKALDNEQLNAFAAMALQTITGADLLETVFIPEAVGPGGSPCLARQPAPDPPDGL